MPKEDDPFKQPDEPDFSFDTMHRALKDSLKQPAIGVTQGGSSRTRGARVAATDATVKQSNR